MKKRPLYFVAFSYDLQPDGMNLSCWLSTEVSSLLDRQAYPFNFKCQSTDFDFWVRGNIDITVKARQMIAETAETIIKQQRSINATRKLSNR